MEYTAVTYEVSDRIATITLNRPERMNSFSTELLAEWADAIKQATEDDEVRVLLVTGAGRAFCAGADLKPRQAVMTAYLWQRRMPANVEIRSDTQCIESHRLFNTVTNHILQFSTGRPWAQEWIWLPWQTFG